MRRQIEQVILYLEGFDRRDAGTTKAEPQSVIPIKRGKEPGDGSVRQYLDGSRAASSGQRKIGGAFSAQTCRRRFAGEST